MGENLFAFVLMPFDSEFGDTYLLGIKSTVEEFGMHDERVDEQVFHREGILERIYNQIDVAELIIADMSGRNPNVFYEVGYAHAKNKVCLLLTKDTTDIPFYLKHHRHIVYGSIQDLMKTLYTDLFVVKDELVKRERPISVELKSISANLVKSKYFATAEVHICLDIHNRTSLIRQI
jgi:nucleoside 2-deoxyribosyltransferase